MLIRSETTKAKLPISSSEHLDDVQAWGKEPIIGTYRRCTSLLVSIESVATGEIHQKGEQNYLKKVKFDEIMNNFPDDGGEACSDTE
ncbi:hypothetical protein GQ457_07G020310 [Hibiscus cannabinus]